MRLESREVTGPLQSAPRPVPEGVLNTLFWAMMVFCKATVPKLKRAPVSVVALPAIVLLVRVKVPLFSIPPPPTAPLLG